MNFHRYVKFFVSTFIFQIKELDLTGAKTGGEIEGLSEEFVSLEVLELSKANITSLKNFPKLPSLKKVFNIFNYRTAMVFVPA